jgi:hypothetical protein
MAKKRCDPQLAYELQRKWKIFAQAEREKSAKINEKIRRSKK